MGSSKGRNDAALRSARQTTRCRTYLIIVHEPRQIAECGALTTDEEEKEEARAVSRRSLDKARNELIGCQSGNRRQLKSKTTECDGTNYEIGSSYFVSLSTKRENNEGLCSTRRIAVSERPSRRASSSSL